MKREDWTEPAPAWDEPDRNIDRAALCLLYLNIHGVISDGEKTKAYRRLEKLTGVVILPRRDGGT